MCDFRKISNFKYYPEAEIGSEKIVLSLVSKAQRSNKKHSTTVNRDSISNYSAIYIVLWPLRTLKLYVLMNIW